MTESAVRRSDRIERWDARFRLASFPFLVWRAAWLLAIALITASVSPLRAQGPAPRPWLDWHSTQTEHFVFHYPSAYREWTFALADRIEALRGEVGDVVGFRPRNRVHIVVDDPVNDANGYAFTALSVPVLLLNPSPFTIMSMLTALVLMVTHRTGTISQALAWRPLLALGAVSYSLYLTHNPVSGAAFFVLDKIGTPQWLALLLTVAACIATAGAFWWAIERPTAELARKVSLRRARHIQDAANGAALNPSK